MCIIKRIVPIVLCIALVCSFFVFSVSAENSSPEVWVQFNNNLKPDGSILTFQNGTYNTTTDQFIYNLQRIYVWQYQWRKGDRLTISIGFRALNNFSFHVPALVSEKPNWYPVLMNLPKFRYTTSFSGWTITDGFSIKHMYVNNQGLTFTIECSKSSYIGDVLIIPDNISAFLNGSDGSVQSDYDIINTFTLHIGTFWQNNHYYNNIQGIYDTLFYMSGEMDDLADAFIYFNRSINQISYDNDGNAIVTTHDELSWVDAIIQLLQSINAPLVQQVQMENKAKEAGADDALDNAYDSVGSSFGSLSDFSDIGSVANWDFDSFSDSASEGILSWFSSDTMNDLDTVPQNRSLPIVDFYSSHIQEIEEGMP